MALLANPFRARVGRRIIVLFVVSALLPVAAMAGVSFVAVNDQLEEHSQERLGQLARNAGQSILQQLRAVETGLHATRLQLEPGSDEAAVLVSLGLVSLGVQEEDGTYRPVVGLEDAPPALDEGEAERLAEGRMVLRTRPGRDAALTAGVALDPVDPTAGVIWARVVNDSIWRPAETFATLPTVVDFCVMSGPGAPLFCSSDQSRFPEAFLGLHEGAPPGTFSMEEAGERYIVGHWSFYPNQAFERDPWTVLVAESAESVYAPLDGFSTTFALALVLAVLLVVLLSNVQIRRTLEPLAALQAGTQSIAAGELDRRVEVSTDDEFGSLAGSFNQMATQLGRQFTQFEAAQAVGEAALGALERDEVLVAALEQFPAVSHCRSAAVLMIPPRELEHGEIAWMTGPGKVGGTQLALDKEDHWWLRSNADWVEASDDALGLVRAVRRGLGKGRLVAFPHLVKGHVQGATLLELDESEGPLTEESARRIRQLADQLAVALDDIRLVKELEEMSWGALVALARAIDAKSQWTAGHSERVTEMALGLGRLMGLAQEDLDTLHRGGLLHDIGKIGVPNDVLDKAGALTDEEFEQIKQHPAIGARILAPIRAFEPAIPIVLQHHEAWDGSGYPMGLAGTDIHPLARILTVADAYDAMASARPYRPGRPPEVVYDVILDDTGTQFDPDVVDALGAYLRDRLPSHRKEPHHAGA